MVFLFSVMPAAVEQLLRLFARHQLGAADPRASGACRPTRHDGVAPLTSAAARACAFRTTAWPYAVRVRGERLSQRTPRRDHVLERGRPGGPGTPACRRPSRHLLQRSTAARTARMVLMGGRRDDLRVRHGRGWIPPSTEPGDVVPCPPMRSAHDLVRDGFEPRRGAS